MIQGLDEETFREFFQELKREDKRAAASFDSAWQSSLARVEATRRRPPIIPLAVPALAMIVICASLLIYLLRGLRQSTPFVASRQASQVSGSQGKTFPSLIGPFGEQRKNSTRGGPQDHPSIQSISAWRSPTAFLLRPPGDSLLTDVPDLKKSLIRIDKFKTVTLN
ncbi:MAG: hypothetical protein LAO31_14820 [Acidobacteriia bacterium]|nr:hypothetical protein [Terriglobia bacterium]